MIHFELNMDLILRTVCYEGVVDLIHYVSSVYMLKRKSYCDHIKLLFPVVMVILTHSVIST